MPHMLGEDTNVLVSALRRAVGKVISVAWLLKHLDAASNELGDRLEVWMIPASKEAAASLAACLSEREQYARL